MSFERLKATRGYKHQNYLIMIMSWLGQKHMHKKLFKELGKIDDFKLHKYNGRIVTITNDVVKQIWCVETIKDENGNESIFFPEDFIDRIEDQPEGMVQITLDEGSPSKDIEARSIIKNSIPKEKQGKVAMRTRKVH